LYKSTAFEAAGSADAPKTAFIRVFICSADSVPLNFELTKLAAFAIGNLLLCAEADPANTITEASKIKSAEKRRIL
jgi:hypothetical protein